MAKSQDNWNEFDWEKEIRRDERRISSYFRELISCIDLPGEEDSIFRKLMSQRDLIPSGVDPENFSLNDFFVGDEEYEAPNDEEWRRRSGAKIVEEFENLAMEYNAIYARNMGDELTEEGLATVCLFGRLLARSIDMVDADDEFSLSLKISLAKRVLADVNDLNGALSTIIAVQPELSDELVPIIDSLHYAREHTVELLNRWRKK